jgi:hypothetical protein
MSTETLDLHLKEPPTEREDGYLLGTVDILGVPHHLQCLRVHDRDGFQQCDGGEVARAWFEDTPRLYDHTLRTVTIPGHAGSWICVVHPYGG